MFSVFARVLSIASRISSPGKCTLRRPVVIAGVEIIVPSLLLQIQSIETFQFLGVMELFL